MTRFMSLLAISLISTNVGCALCSSCDDYSYGAFGGLWERQDMTYGRVGSAFTPQGFLTSEGLPADQSEAVTPDGAEPTAPPAPAPPAPAPPAEETLPNGESEEGSLLST